MRITVLQNGNKVSCGFSSPALLSELLQKCGLGFCMPCGGRKTCNKCEVCVQGELLPPDVQEKKLLSGKSKNTRYACMATACGDVTVILNDDFPQIIEANKNLAAAPGGNSLCVDIGTSTLTAALYNGKGEFERSVCCHNSQRIFGSDVVTRLNKAVTDAAPLQNAILNDIERLSQNLNCPGGIDNAVICGNTAMMYLLCGINPGGLLTPPFAADNLFGGYLPKGALKINALKGARVFLSPCVSAYIGGDITAGILAVNLCENDKPCLFADVGTNCETVLWANGKLYAASAPAGPVFEGANISCGTNAVQGAVCGVDYAAGNFTLKTVGDKAPIGFCGTGVIEFVHALKKCGIIDKSGSIVAVGHGLHHYIKYMGETPYVTLPGTNLFFSDEDIRNVQYAKSAVCSGIEVLLDYAGLRPADIEKFYLAGGFGTYIDPYKAANIGLFPKELADKAVYCQNAAADGAVLLTNDANKEKCKKIAKQIETLNLTGNARFAERFIENLNF